MIPTYVILGVIALFLLISSLKSFGINQEYQRGVLFPPRPARADQRARLVLADPVC